MTTTPDTALRVRPSARLRVAPGVHYSRMVYLLKILLPLIAGVLIVLTVLWPDLNRVEQYLSGQAPPGSVSEAALQDNLQVQMENARFIGADRHKKPYTVTASRAIQLEGAPNAPELVRLEEPQADITLSDGTWLALTANIGFFKISDNRLALNGAVNVFHDKGYEIVTSTASIDLDSGFAEGSDPVRGQGPFGLLRGEDGFEIRDGGNIVIVKGRSKLIIDQLPGEAAAMKAVWLGAVLCFLVVTAPMAGAQSLLAADMSGGPLEVDAEQGIEWRQGEDTFIARGNAVARRGGSEVRADELIAHYREVNGATQIYLIEAIGTVNIASHTEKVFGDRAVYDLDKAVAVVTGSDLRLTTPTDLVTARDSLEYWENRNIAVARGGASITREDRVLRAETLTANLTRDRQGALRVTQVDALDNVNITTANEFVSGDKGVYDVDRDIAVLEGSVKITRGENQLNGDRAEVNLKTGISRLTSLKQSGRVQGLLVPKSAEDN